MYSDPTPAVAIALWEARCSWGCARSFLFWQQHSACTVRIMCEQRATASAPVRFADVSLLFLLLLHFLFCFAFAVNTAFCKASAHTQPLSIAATSRLSKLRFASPALPCNQFNDWALVCCGLCLLHLVNTWVAHRGPGRLVAASDVVCCARVDLHRVSTCTVYRRPAPPAADPTAPAIIDAYR